jgi:predicted RNA-binding Zn-ribbon protein involved in translation (DUF1610 family)
MALNFLPPTGFVQIESKLEGITVFAPAPEIDFTPEARDFKCPQCGATTAFTPSSGGITCSNCGYAQIDRREVVGQGAAELEFTLANLAIAARGWGADRSELHCESCGADLSVAASELSSTCPFCASNRVISRVANQDFLRPRFLIPFLLEPDNCKPLIKAWLDKGWMHPADLSRAAASTQLQGIYLPFWTFDATIQAEWNAEVGYERTERYYDSSSKSWKTRTQIDWRWESGQVTLHPNDWLGIGTTRISQILIKRLYPFNMDALTAYKPDYLAGWRTLKYDVPLLDAWDSVKVEMRQSAKESCRSQINSTHVRNFSMLADFGDETWRYILLPVYAAAYRFDGQTFQVLVNGQTGIVVGQKPVAWWKVWLAIVGLLTPSVITAIIGLLFMLFGGIGVLILGLAAILFTVGVLISIYIFRQAAQAGEI